MPKRLNPKVNFHQQRFMQISESHCGPAVVQMQLSNLEIEVTQEAIAEEGGAAKLIEMNGMRVDQLSQAVRRLAPGVCFFYKEHATIDEMVRIVNDYHYPVGVEWQGVFEDEIQTVLEKTDAGLIAKNETEENDYGHYSLVVHVDRRKQTLLIADPYKDYFSQARIFSFEFFDKRWFDFNEVKDLVSEKPILVKDDHLLFVIVGKKVRFPRQMGMKDFS